MSMQRKNKSRLMKNDSSILERMPAEQSRRVMPLIMVFIASAIFLCLCGCGKKAPPFLPGKIFSGKVVNLQGDYQDGMIILKGEIKGQDETEKVETLVSGCRVYYVQYPLDNPPCTNCPIEYHDQQRFGAEVVTKEGFFCKIQDVQGERVYFLKVLLIGPDGSMGPPSERVEVETK